MEEYLNKIICGDCLGVMKKLPDKCVDLVLTDPPYGIDYQSARRTADKRKPKIANDKEPFTIWLKEASRILKDNGGLLCFTRFDTEESFRQAIREAGLTDKMQIIWDKVVHGMGDLVGDFASQHENIIWATKNKFKFPNKRPTSIFKVQRVDPEKLVHPNEKPIPLLYMLIDATTNKDDIVLDCFAGSGATLVASQKTNRNFIGIEISPEYCKIAEERLKNLQGTLL